MTHSDLSLAGKWLFKRNISEPLLQFDGMAEFTSLLQDGGMQRVEYYEGGEYILNGQLHLFEQRQIWEVLPNELRIYKNDGQLLHIFLLDDTQQAEHTHFCGADVYQCKFIIADQNNFALHYNVQGPHKNYTLTTFYAAAND